MSVHRTLLSASLLSLFIVGCGSADNRTTSDAETSLPTVEMSVSSPQDGSTVRSSRVEVRGTVIPTSAQVQVNGRRAEVQNGLFRIKVRLRRGENTLTVEGAAPEATPASVTVAVTRNRSQDEIRAAVQRRKERDAKRRAAAEARKHADDYPADIRQNFIDSCTIDGTQSGCECALDRIEKTVTLRQFILADQLASQTGIVPGKIQDAYLACS